MKKIIWLEMLLLGSSVLIFRSVWSFLDTMSWARETTGLGLLLVTGIAMTVFALVKFMQLKWVIKTSPKNNLAWDLNRFLFTFFKSGTFFSDR